MTKNECINCIELYKRLKEKVVGNVFTTIDKDVFIVVIYGGSVKGVKFEYNYKGLSYEYDMITHRLNYDKIVKIIIDEYKRFISSKFFKEVNYEKQII